MANDSEVAYETILKYSDKNFYPNKNYKKNNDSDFKIHGKKEILSLSKKLDEKNCYSQNMLSIENIPRNVPQLNSQNDSTNVSVNFSEKNIQNIQNIQNGENIQNIENVKNIQNAKELNDIRYLRLNRRLLHKNSFHIALTACSGSGDVITAYRIIDLMVEHNIPIKIDTFNALLDTVRILKFHSILTLFLFFFFLLVFFQIFISNFLSPITLRCSPLQ